MRNTKRNCFSHSSTSPRNDKQCFANHADKQIVVCGGPKQNLVETLISDTYVDKEKHRHRSLFRKCSDENIVCTAVTQTINRGCAKPFRFLILVSCLLFFFFYVRLRWDLAACVSGRQIAYYIFRGFIQCDYMYLHVLTQWSITVFVH